MILGHDTLLANRLCNAFFLAGLAPAAIGGFIEALCSKKFSGAITTAILDAHTPTAKAKYLERHTNLRTTCQFGKHFCADLENEQIDVGTWSY